MISIELQAFHIKKLVLASASTATAYPFLHAAYDWHNRKQYLNKWLHELEDIDSTLAQATRNQLHQKNYPNANIIPIKVYEGSHAMEAVCDGMIGFSYQHAEHIKKALADPSKTESLSTLSVFKHDLDHEMFHIEDQHAKKSTAAYVWTPGLVEVAALPVTRKLLQIKSSKLFTLGALASIPIKFGTIWLLNRIHRRNQEYRAEVAAIQKNHNINDLRNVEAFRKEILEKGMTMRLAELFAGDTSNSIVLPILMKTFNQKIDFDLDRANSDDEYREEQLSKITKIYNKFHDQPYHWPLRVMSLEQDMNETQVS